MRLRNIRGAKEAIDASAYVANQEDGLKGKWRSLFQNENPIHIEIGMGKGKFLVESALRNPHINYIGIERYSSVLYRAVQKVEEMDKLPNLLLLHMDAGQLLEVFDVEEIDQIYLNFSDPWPKDRHAKRRLNSKEFLNIYDGFLKKDGCIVMKTDNEKLFDFGLEETAIANWKIVYHNRNLHEGGICPKDNVMTEYESKFVAVGNPIYKFIITR